jgi:hypothetical protein
VWEGQEVGERRQEEGLDQEGRPLISSARASSPHAAGATRADDPSPRADRFARTHRARASEWTAPSRGGRVGALALIAAAALALSAAPALAAPPSQFGGPEGEGGGQFHEPGGIAVDQASGDSYVVDRFNRRVEKFGSDGEFLLAWGWGVADGTTAAPQTCGPQSADARCFAGLAGEGPGQFGDIRGVAVDNDSSSPAFGDVYVSDAQNHRVQAFGPAGEFELMIGGEVDKTSHADLCTKADLEAGDECGAGNPGSGSGEFEAFEGNTLGVGPDGTLFVGDSGRVQKFSPGGTSAGQFALPGATTVAALTVDSAGDVYLTAEGLQGTHKYEPDGTELGKPREPLTAPFAVYLTTGPADEVVLDHLETGSVKAFDSTGAQAWSFSEAGSTGTGRGVTYSDEAGSLLLLHSEFVRVLAPPTPGTPFVESESTQVSEVSPTSASLNAILNPEGGEETTYHFEYGTDAGYGQSTAITPLAVNEIQSLTLTATEGTFTLAFEGEASAAIGFEASAGEVQAALEAIPAIGAADVAVDGPIGGPWSIEFIGSLAATDVAELSADASGLGEFGEPGSATIATGNPGGGFSDRAISVAISGLQPATSYHFRLSATNKAGKTTEGPDQSFETLPPVSILSTSVGAVTSTSATLEAELNPHGLAGTYQFQYGLSTAYGSSAPPAEASAGQGSGPAPVTAIVQGLAPDTTYHYRVVARNSLGPSLGPDREFTTQGAVATVLPDGRGWELVSPAEKNGIPLEANGFEGGVDQAAAGGGGFAYTAKGALGADPAGSRSFLLSQYLARRGPGGWTSEDVTTPHQAVAGGVAGRSAEYKFYSDDLSLGAVEPEGATPLSSLTKERTPYLRNAAGEFIPLANAGNVAPGVTFGGRQEEGKPELWIGGVFLVAVTPDLGDIVLGSGQSLTPGLPPGDEYLWSAGTLTLFTEVPPAGGPACGGPGPACVPATSEGEEAALGAGNVQTRAAVSRDGNRLVFETETGGSHRLFLRDQSRGETVHLDAVEPDAKGGAGEPIFQDATPNGSDVFFTDASRLTTDSTAREGEPDLYKCEIRQTPSLACELKDLSVDPHAGQHAQVQGLIPGVGGEGRFVYFVANGALAEGAVTGSCAENEPLDANAGELCNLYSYDVQTATTSLVAVISGFDSPDWGSRVADGLSHLTARVSPDGRWLSFMSRRPLTGYDNRDAITGIPDEEVFLYHQPDAPSGRGSLICASCDPTGGRPHGALQADQNSPRLLVDQYENWVGQPLAGSIPGWTKHNHNAASYQPRYLSDSGRLFFDAADPLVPQDSNATEDAYEFEPTGVGGCSEQNSGYRVSINGCADLISAGTSPEESAFLDASESGDDAFFLTASKLAPTDVDNALDIYDARGGGAAQAVATVAECAGDACQVPATPPSHPTPGSVLLDGPGNVVPCPRGKVKKAGKCVKKHHKKNKKKHHKKSDKKQKKANDKRATKNRGGAR